MFKLSSGRTSTKFYVLVGFLVFFWILGKFVHFQPEQMKQYLLQFSPTISGLVFVGLYIVLTFFIWFAKDVFLIAGGWIYGLWGSSFLIWAAEVLNAAILFALTRKLGRDFIAGRASERLKNFDQRIADVRFLDLFLLRAIVLIPFRYLDLGFGLTRVSFRKYMMAVFVASPIRVVMRQGFVVFAGHVLATRDFEGLINTYLALDQDVLLMMTIGSTIYMALTVYLFFRAKKLVFG